MSTPRPSSASQSTALAIATKPQKSLNKQVVLDEDDYTEGLGAIIARDFFPSLVHLDATNQYLSALESQDPSLINASVRRLSALASAAPTPTPRSRGGNGGVTPYVNYPSDTPLRTPRFDGLDQPPAAKRPKYDKSLTLDQFQARYTSEDNASFTEILDDENKKRKEKYAWAWNAQDRAGARRAKEVEGRERMMIEGSSRMMDGPGQRAITNEGLKALTLNGEPGPSALGRKERIRDEDENSEAEVARELEEEEEGETGQLVISTPGKPIVDAGEEPVDVMAPLKDKRPAGVHSWPFKTRNSLMFPPDADESPYHRPPTVLTTVEKDDARHAAPMIVHANTRLPEQSEGLDGSHTPQPPSPSRSRVAAAISGTPYLPRSDSPKVQGFGYVEAVPSPSPSELGPDRVKELMTWGTLLATPRILSSSDDPTDLSPSPFQIKAPYARDELGRRLGSEAGRALAKRAELLGGGLPKKNKMAGKGKDSEEKKWTASTPKRVDMLTPAARRLLDRTKAGGGLTSGSGGSSSSLSTPLGPGHTPIAKGARRQLQPRTGKLMDLRKVGWDADSPRATR
ncbi:hypothetical protein FRB96_006908 [Tulasnella sp. 330]|nr:hypothetical protein FRB96_006908 [Tulasnella sp. 330]KAG8869498.1 hypothetical protein FRB97_001096 [Tulasnella sp. 331]KAG8889338.1 hypothetical protein FRB98_004622 [Tulasnella sp. 332]